MKFYAKRNEMHYILTYIVETKIDSAKKLIKSI